MSTTVTRWGLLDDATPVHLYTLGRADGPRVTLSDLGGAIVSWFTPDRDGKLADIVLGHDRPTDYFAGTTYMGALIGRWANRIAGARFTLDGVDYALDRNQGENLLHGGFNGFHRARWQTDPSGDAITFTHYASAGEAGFPGALTVTVRYSFEETAAGSALTIAYDALADAPTPVNLTNHAYFNLAGAGDVRGHRVSIDADTFYAVDATLIPTHRAEVAGTPFDLRAPAEIGARLDMEDAQLTLARGFDHCFVLRGGASATEMPALRDVASVFDPASGRELTVATTERGLQFYTGNYLEGTPAKGDGEYAMHAGLCLEAGGFPNEVNMESAERVILRPGERYRQETRYTVRTK